MNKREKHNNSIQHIVVKPEQHKIEDDKGKWLLGLMITVIVVWLGLWYSIETDRWPKQDYKVVWEEQRKNMERVRNPILERIQEAVIIVTACPVLLIRPVKEINE